MKKIFSIDDEEHILSCFHDALTAEGYEFASTSDPAEGMETVRNRDDIDLLMLDVKMPGIDGFEIYRSMKDHEQVPVLFVTAYPKSFDMDKDDVMTMWQEQFADGTTDILYKPFELQTLYDKVAGLIGPAND